MKPIATFIVCVGIVLTDRQVDFYAMAEQGWARWLARRTPPAAPPTPRTGCRLGPENAEY